MTSLDKWSSLNPRLVNALEEVVVKKLNFPYLMPVQKAVVPLFIANKDVVVEAATGSGKTLAFILPIFDYCLKSKMTDKSQLHSLILSPIRELAIQSYEIAKQINEGLNHKFTIGMAVGGVKDQENVSNNILFGTPGRIKELTENGKLDFKNLEMLVLDEADRMMSKEYLEDLMFLIKKMPKQRRNGLFSATMSWLSNDLIKKLGLRFPVKIEVNAGEGLLPTSLACFSVTFESREDKIPAIETFISHYKPKKCILFLNTCAGAELYGKLVKFSNFYPTYEIVILHGKQKQKKRSKNLELFFKAGKALLFTTDLASRGIDFPDIDLILQIDPPQEPSNFVHRAGRTARVGKRGNAILFLDHHEEPFNEYLQLQHIKVEHIDMPPLSGNEGKFVKSLKDGILKDRIFIEKSKSAFVTFIRSYKEHKVHSISQFS